MAAEKKEETKEVKQQESAPKAPEAQAPEAPAVAAATPEPKPEVKAEVKKEKPSNCAGHHPCKQGNVQTRNTHQMRDTRRPEKIPIRALDGRLIAHHQCRNHASHRTTLRIA